MNKLLRRVIRLAVVLVLVPVLVVIAAALFLPKDKIRDLAADRLAAATGGQVELGEPSLRFRGGLGVSLAGGILRGTGPELAAATGSQYDIEDYAVHLDRLDIDVALGPLLSRRLLVRAVRIEGSQLDLRHKGGEARALDFDVVLTGLSLGLAAAAEGARSGAQATTMPPGQKIPADLSCDIAVRIGQLVLDRVPYDEVILEGRLENRVLEVPTFAARRSTGTVTGFLTVDYATDPWGAMRFSANVDQVPAAALLEPIAPDLGAQLDSNLDVQVEGSCGLKNKDAALGTLSLEGLLEGREGVLHAGPWLREALPYLGDRQDLKDVTFRTLRQAFRMRDGRLLVDNLHIDGVETEWHGSGWVGLAGMMDLGIKVRLPAGFTPELGQWSFLADGLRDPEGRVNLAFRLTGATARPRVGIDFAGMQGGASAEGQEAAVEAARKGLGDLLDKWKTK